MVRRVNLTGGLPGEHTDRPQRRQALCGQWGCDYIQAFNGIEIADETIFAFGVGIVSANHDPSNLADSRPRAPLRSGRRCWLRMNAVSLPGAELGSGCIVAAGAAVTRSFAPGSTVAGVAARLIVGSTRETAGDASARQRAAE